MKTITIRDFIEAARKNGYPWGKGEYIIRDKDGKVIFACLYGQAALNLGVNPDSLTSRVEDIRGHGTQSLFEYNDYYASSYEDAVAHAEYDLSNDMNRTINVYEDNEGPY